MERNVDALHKDTLGHLCCPSQSRDGIHEMFGGRSMEDDQDYHEPCMVQGKAGRGNGGPLILLDTTKGAWERHFLPGPVWQISLPQEDQTGAVHSLHKLIKAGFLVDEGGRACRI